MFLSLYDHRLTVVLRFAAALRSWQRLRDILIVSQIIQKLHNVVNSYSKICVNYYCTEKSLHLQR